MHAGYTIAMAVVAVLSIFGIASCRAPETRQPVDIEQHDFDFFLEKSSCRTTISGQIDSLEDELCRFGNETTTVDEAIAAYAKALRISAYEASRHAELLILGVKHQQDCTDWSNEQRPSCLISDNAELMNALRDTGLTEKTGRLLIAAGETLARDRSREFFIDLILEHPKSSSILTYFIGYSGDHAFRVPELGLSDTPRSVLRAAMTSAFDEFDSASLLALLSVSHEAASDEIARHTAAAALLVQLMERGMNSTALVFFDSLNEKTREQLMNSRSKIYDFGQPEMRHFSSYFYGGYRNGVPEHEKLSSAGVHIAAQLRLNLSATLFVEGRTDEAKAMLTSVIDQRDDLHDYRALHVDILSEIVDRRLPDEHVFDFFVFGYPYSTGVSPPEDLDRYTGGDMRGWLGSLKPMNPAIRGLASQYLRSRDYDGMANYVLSGDRYYQYGFPRGVPERHAEKLGVSFERAKSYYEAEIEAAEAEYQRLRTTARADSFDAIELLDRPVVFEEVMLAESQQNAPPLENEVPDLENIGLWPHQIVRAHRSEEIWTVVYTSHALDPVGEVSLGGYWVVQSNDDGATWDTPIYLGFQQFFPYDVVRESALPLIDDGTLQLEVAIREIDRRAITFPPIGLLASRQVEGLALQFDMEALVRDSDSDGLTDVVEHRLGLSMTSPDTDGDGLDDGTDSLPNVSFDPLSDDRDLAAAIIEVLHGFERGAIIVGAPQSAGDDPESFEHIMQLAGVGAPVQQIDPSSTLFLEGEPEQFAGLTLPYRLMIHTANQAKILSETYGVFYSAGVRWTFKDQVRDRYYMIWDASWVGGAFLVERTPDGYQITEIRRWIS